MSLLAPIKPFFKYSMDLNSQFPVVAYYLKFYAVTKGFDLLKAAPQGSNTTDQKAFLKNELSELETMFTSLPGGSKEDHRYQVENFVLSVFAKVDKDERTCEKVTKNNAIDFKRCGDFISMMTIFGELEPEWQERERFCKYKAGTILKCLKNGEEPPRGNPFVQEEPKTDFEPLEEVKEDHSSISQMMGSLTTTGLSDLPIYNPPNPYAQKPLPLQ